MKKNVLSNRTLIISLVFALLFSSCTKERIEDEKDLIKYESLQEFLDSKKQEEQEFVIDTTGTDPIVGKFGTKIWPDKTALMYENGDSVQWPYTVKLIELYSAEEMLYYSILNHTETSFYNCEAEVRIRAFKDGEELVLRPNRTWNVEVKDSLSEYNKAVYYEEENSNPFYWTESADIYTLSEYGYFAQVSNLGWNAPGENAYVYDNAKVTLASETDDLTTVSSYVYMPNKKSLTMITNLESVNLSLNEEVVIFCLAIDSNKKLYMFNQEFTVTGNMLVPVQMKEVTDEELTIFLKGL